MANRYRNLIYSTAEYTQVYNGIRGVELNGSSKTNSTSRLAYAQNVYRDYDGDGAEVIESIPGYRCFSHYGKKIHALYYHRSALGGEDHLIVHVGNKLMHHPVSDIYLENAKGTEIATVDDVKSFGFEYGIYFYVMDTTSIFQISDDGTCKTVGSAGSYPYIPTTYVNGEPYEQRNLLISDFKEEFYISDPNAYLFSSSGIKYKVTDDILRYCTVKGIENSEDAELYIPAYVDISGIQYKVISIDTHAFSSNSQITALYLPDGIIRICPYAFENCTSLHTVVTSNTLTNIDENAFSGCEALSTIYLGEAISVIKDRAFKNCAALTSIHYALERDEFIKISGYDTLDSKYVSYSSKYEPIKITLPFHDKVHSITSVDIDGTNKSFGTIADGTTVLGVTLTFPRASDATGVKAIVTGKLAPLEDDWLSDMTALAPVEPYQAITNCRIAEVFDGRIFFSGNPNLPNTVFYTERANLSHNGALYVGRYNYFNDGVGSRKVNGMLAVRDMLAVFKEEDDGAGSIFYHRKEGTGLGALNTVYPVAYTHSELCSTGQCQTFLDDPVFLTKEGLMALDKENIDYQRNVAIRSHNVNYFLLKEDLSKAQLCEWLGYLVLGVNGKIFLADSRAMFAHTAGSWEYEWFLLTDIGAYNGDKPVYVYSPDPIHDAVAHPSKTFQVANGESVYSVTPEDGNTYYYVSEGDIKYRVVPTEEKHGGAFYPATVFLCHDKLLMFATDDGHLCVFNNDMRGVAPKSVKESPDYDEDEYIASMGDKIHPLFYSFVGHAPKYVLKTSLDDCGIPHLTKNTVKKSLIVKAKSYEPDSILCEVKSDGNDPVEVALFPAGEKGFDDFDFTFSPWYKNRYVSTALPENEKRWVEKQIILSSDKFASPISIYSITYRYTIKGKIKNNI